MGERLVDSADVHGARFGCRDRRCRPSVARGNVPPEYGDPDEDSAAKYQRAGFAAQYLGTKGVTVNATDGAAQGQSCIQGCAGTQTCTGYGTWDPFCHATNCQPFPLAASQNYDCSDACFGASCDDYASVQCPYGTVPTGECDANCISGCCVGQTSGTGCDWGASLVGAKDACWLHMGTAGCNGMTMSVTAWCVGQPN